MSNLPASEMTAAADQRLPIECAPSARPMLSEHDRRDLNESLLAAKLAASEARELEATLLLKRQEAQGAAQAFIDVRSRVSQACGVSIGETHGWDSVTGELRPVARGR